MIGTTHTIPRLAQGIAVAIAVAALIAPPGLAGSTTHNASHDPWYGYAVSLTARDARQHLITDTLGGTGRPEQAPAYRFVTDTLAPGGGSSLAVTGTFQTEGLPSSQCPCNLGLPDGPNGVEQVGLAPTTVTKPRGSFDWTDAGIGAAGAIGAVLFMVGGSLVVVRRRGRLAF